MREGECDWEGEKKKNNLALEREKTNKGGTKMTNGKDLKDRLKEKARERETVENREDETGKATMRTTEKRDEGNTKIKKECVCVWGGREGEREREKEREREREREREYLYFILFLININVSIYISLYIHIYKGIKFS